MKIYRLAIRPRDRDRQLRNEGHLPSWRYYAHRFFDKLWTERRYGFTRDEAYAALAEYMGLPSEEAHMGHFNVEQCKQVVEWAQGVTQALDDLDRDFGVNQDEKEQKARNLEWKRKRLGNV